jgi:lysophospholipid acyltransferase (LPLAT)-like uncharacterized protein
MKSLLASIAYQSGKAFAHYCLWAAGSNRVHIEGEAYIPTGPAVLAGWHTPNLLSLAFHYYYLYKLPALCFIPPGIVGIAARGKLEGFGLQGVELPAENTGNPTGALKHTLRALSEGKVVVFAVDGPYGPIYRVQPGAIWLARASGCPLIPMGFAARPALRWLRWDHQITPLPGACMAAIVGPPIQVDGKREIDARLCAGLGATIDQLTQRAWEVVNGSVRKQDYSTPAWLPRRGQGNFG